MPIGPPNVPSGKRASYDEALQTKAINDEAHPLQALFTFFLILFILGTSLGAPYSPTTNEIQPEAQQLGTEAAVYAALF